MASQEKKKNITWKEIKKQKVLIIWSLVLVIYGVIFYYLPLAGWAMAFQDYKPKNGLFHSAFVGMDKFKQLFSDASFIRVIRNTLGMGVINLIVTFVMAILFAILLNEVKSNGGKKTVQTISYLPHFLSWIIVTGILHDALSSTGIINELLLKFHILTSRLISSRIQNFSGRLLHLQMCGRRQDGMPLSICPRLRQLTRRFTRRQIWTAQDAGRVSAM